MKIEIPKVIRPLDLAEYGAEYSEAVINVWVNPPRAKREEFQATRIKLLELTDEIQQIAKEFADHNDQAYIARIKSAGERMTALNRAVYTWHSDIWSQEAGDEWSPEQVEEFADQAMEYDPQLWQYALRRTAEMIWEYRSGRQKK